MIKQEGNIPLWIFRINIGIGKQVKKVVKSLVLFWHEGERLVVKGNVDCTLGLHR